jgi:hypothetical protein
VRRQVRGDVPRALVAQAHGIDAREQVLATAQERGGDGEVDLVDQSCDEILPNGGHAAAQSNVLPSCRLSRPHERGMDAVGDEVERRSTFHRDRLAGVVREHEDGHVVRRVRAPPSLPLVVGPGPAHGPEHVAAHDPGAQVLEAARGELIVDVLPGGPAANERLSEVARDLLEGLRAEHPLVQRHSSDAHRVRQILRGPGAVAVDGNSEPVDPKARHESHSLRQSAAAIRHASLRL